MSRETRKLDHIRLARAFSSPSESDFDDLRLVHRSFPEVGFRDCEINTDVCGVILQSPILINAMTGGAFSTMDINRNLAEISKETGIAMAVGSQRSALKNPDMIDTYRIVRKINTDGIIIANLGAGATRDEGHRAIDMLQANLLQLHVNIPQELVMPEGDRDFTGIVESISRIVESVEIPVIVKEVGFGMCRETYKQLMQTGVQAIDVGGRGGTNFIWIEDQRRQVPEYQHLAEWGQSTVISLLEAIPYHHRFDMISSGGIRNTLDIIKSCSLGAKAVGMAGAFLKGLQDQGVQGVIDMVDSWHQQVRTIMAMLGTRRIADLTSIPMVVAGNTKDWCTVRGIDLQSLANR